MTLSVIIANYNHSQYLPECLDAILAQSRPPEEVLVVDDASTDDSCEVVMNYREKHPFISLIRLEKNSGGPQIPSLIGLKHAKGAYVALSAADDLVQPGFFETAMGLCTQFPDIGLCCGDVAFFQDSKPYAFHRIQSSGIDEKTLFSPENFIKHCAATCFYIHSHSTIYRRDLILKYGGYRDELKSLCDVYLNYQIALRHPIAYVPSLFAAYRVLPQSYGQSFRFHLLKRYRLCAAFMRTLRREGRLFRSRFQKSGMLSQGGIFMMLYLVMHPLNWKYLYPAFLKLIKSKIKK